MRALNVYYCSGAKLMSDIVLVISSVVYLGLVSVCSYSTINVFHSCECIRGCIYLVTLLAKSWKTTTYKLRMDGAITEISVIKLEKVCWL